MSTAMIDGERLLSPTPGTFRAATVLGGPIRPGAVLGTVWQAGQPVTVHVPEGIAGAALTLADGQWVQCGDVLCQVGEGVAGEFVAPTLASDDIPDGCTAVRAETDGTVYLRPEPTAPAFVALAQAVATGTTLALVEVMKTFTPVRAAFDGTVREVRVTDGQSVAADQVLLVIGPAMAEDGPNC